MAKHTSVGYAVLLILAIATGLTTLPVRAQSLVDKAERDQVESVADDDPLMLRAFAKARETLPGFLDMASHPKRGTDGFGVKVAVHEGDQVEYFWIAPFTQTGEKFAGTVDNEPNTVHSVRLGQTITFSQNEIVDWTYMDGKTMMGNYTARVLLQKASPAERAE